MRVGLCAVIAALGFAVVPAAMPVFAPRSSVVGPGVEAGLAQRGHVGVVVAFRPAPARTLAGAVRMAEAVRARVLGRVRGQGFRQTARWDSVLAMPGDVNRAGLARLAADPEVARIDLDGGGGRGDDAESSPLIGVPAARAAGLTGAGVTVAVLDTGVDRSHPDLSPALIAEHCFAPPDGCPNGAGEQDGPGSAQDDFGHGTNVAGILVGRGRVAPQGIAPDAKLVAVKVLDRSNRFQSSSQIVSALNWIALNQPDVKVVNMSLGSDVLFSGTCDDAAAWTLAYASVVASLRARGVIVFASSGNNGSATRMQAPACIDGVVAVGAVYDSAFGALSGRSCSVPATAADKVACFSNSDSALDLLAPGAIIVSSGLGGGTSAFVGTSQASPHAAGAAALLLQKAPLTPSGIESLLKTSGVAVTDTRNGITTPRVALAAALAPPGSKISQTITFSGLAPKTYGDADFALSASASSGLPVAFAPSGNCTVIGTTVHLTGAGSCTITASQAGDANYDPAAEISQSFAITRLQCTVPKLVGKKLAAAKAALARGHCRAGKVSFAYSSTRKQGTVTSQSRRPGQMLPAGSKVNLVISRGRRR